MSIAIINFATLRIERSELTRILIALRQENFCLLAVLNADDLRNDRQRNQTESNNQNQRTDGVLLSHLMPPIWRRSSNHSSNDWAYSLGNGEEKLVTSCAAAKISGSGVTKPGTAM